MDDERTYRPGHQPYDRANGIRVGGIAGAVAGGVVIVLAGLGGSAAFGVVAGAAALGGGAGYAWQRTRDS